GTLVSRKLESAVITDEDLAIKRVIKMIKESKVTSINGKEVDLKADSICVHGDGIKALEFVKKIKENLTKEQIQIKALNDFIN
ncbi:LamB/YcsF family protein, partial [Campylobacter coli]|nr:LamB/YcsF family protein [Campylobacter coli]